MEVTNVQALHEFWRARDAVLFLTDISLPRFPLPLFLKAYYVYLSGCCSTPVDIREQLVRVSSLSLHHAVPQVSNSYRQAWLQAPVPTKPAHQPSCVFLLFRDLSSVHSVPRLDIWSLLLPSPLVTRSYQFCLSVNLPIF